MKEHRQFGRTLVVLMFWGIGGALGFGEGIDRQTSQGSGIEVSVRALDLSQGPSELQRFEVELTTHGTNLDFDLTKIAFLSNEKGAVVSAGSWTGGRGGHHLSGILSFQAQDLLGFESLELILDLPGFGRRSFSWPPKIKVGDQ